MNYSDGDNSADFYSETSETYRGKPSDEPEVFTVNNDLDRVKQLIISNIFPGVISGMKMLMITLPNNCSVQAKSVEGHPEDPILSTFDQLDPFIERMLKTGESFVVGSKYISNHVEISMAKPDAVNNFRSNVSCLFTRKNGTGTNRSTNK